LDSISRLDGYAMNNIKLSAVIELDREYKATLKRPANWILDKIADEKMNGGYTKRNTKCTKCNTLKSSNGTCYC
jgi:hypothetical protein